MVGRKSGTDRRALEVERDPVADRDLERVVTDALDHCLSRLALALERLLQLRLLPVKSAADPPSMAEPMATSISGPCTSLLSMAAPATPPAIAPRVAPTAVRLPVAVDRWPLQPATVSMVMIVAANRRRSSIIPFSFLPAAAFVREPTDGTGKP